MAMDKLSYPQLALLDWLCEKPGRFYVSSGGGLESRSISLHEYTVPDEDGKRSVKSILNGIGNKGDEEKELLLRIGGKLSADFHRLSSNKFTEGFSHLSNRAKYQKFMEQFGREYFHYSSVIHLLTPAGREYWQTEGRELLQKQNETIRKKEEEVSRLVVIGRMSTLEPKLPDNVRRLVNDKNLPIPNMSRRLVRPYAIARVIKESPSRLYIRDVELLKIPDANWDWRNDPISGREPNQFTTPESVICDNATKPGAKRLVELDREYAEDINAISVETIVRALPVLEEAYSRLSQKLAEREDMVRDLIESIGSDSKKDQDLDSGYKP